MSSHLTTVDLIFIAGPAVLIAVALVVSLVWAIVSDVRDSRIF